MKPEIALALSNAETFDLEEELGSVGGDLSNMGANYPEICIAERKMRK